MRTQFPNIPFDGRYNRANRSDFHVPSLNYAFQVFGRRTIIHLCRSTIISFVYW